MMGTERHHFGIWAPISFGIGEGSPSSRRGLEPRSATHRAQGGRRAAGWKPKADGHLKEMELSRLRAENARLKMHVEILKKATAYFAKDAL